MWGGVATREVYDARVDLQNINREFEKATGIFQTRRDHAQARLDRALELQRRLKEERDRLEYTLRSAFQSTLGGSNPGGRVTFIQDTSAKDLRRRIREIDAKLNEAPGP